LYDPAGFDPRRYLMPVVVVHEGPTMTQEAYEKVVREVTGGKSRLESPDD
jgi:hypothetical protein